MKDMLTPPCVLDGYEEVIDGLRRWRTKIEESLAYSNNTHTFDDVCQAVLTGQMQFFNFDRSFAIMELKIYPQARVYHCFLAGGDLDAVLDNQAPVIDVAKMADCSFVTLSGRKGWERAFKPDGWLPYCTALYKPVSTGEKNGQQ